MTNFDFQAEEREGRLALKRRRAYDEELLRGLLGRTHAESVRDFFQILGCFDLENQKEVVKESKGKEYAY